MSYQPNYAAPTVSVEIYPASGLSIRPYIFDGSGVISCTVSKSIEQLPNETFSIVLPPGGPAGETGYDWCEYITPMSLVLIGMQRAGQANIVMVGIVTEVSESFDIDNSVVRYVTVNGEGMGYFFTNYSYYTLGVLGGLGGSVLGAELGIGAVASSAIIGQGYSYGTPQQIATNFIEQVMFGQGFGLMQNTQVYYKNAAPIKLSNIFNTAIQGYDSVNVFFDYSFITSEQTWQQKIDNILPAPFYEFFVMTCQDKYYGPDNSSNGQAFSMQSMPTAKPVIVTVVGRPNPTPTLTVSSPTASAGGGGTITGVDLSLWNNLVENTPDQLSATHWDISFSIGQTANYFAIMPTWAQTMFGAGNTLANSWILTQETAVDSGSIINFGYRPMIVPTLWYGDSTGKISDQTSENFPQLSATLIARLISTYGPRHLFAMATVKLPLRPDIMPGTKFTFPAFKDGTDWTFYVISVEHQFEFGGGSGRSNGTFTQLVLDCGLPTELYQAAANGGTSEGNLQNLLAGRMVRANGQYLLDENAPGVRYSGSSAGLQAIIANISTAFNAPGGSDANPLPPQ